VELLSQTTIVGIASTYRTSKILVQLSTTDGTHYESNEITILNDGTDIYFSDYGNLSNSTRADEVGQGIGTFSAYISGSNY